MSDIELPLLNYFVAKFYYSDRKVKLSDSGGSVMVLRNPVFDGSEYHHWFVFNPVEQWEHGGPIIDRECIFLTHNKASKQHGAYVGDESWFQKGDTSLIAVMRCYVASKCDHVVDLSKNN